MLTNGWMSAILLSVGITDKEIVTEGYTMIKIRRSRQRDAIMTYLRSRTDHPSAEQIYENVKQTMPNISLGTVYRNLTLLNDLGEVRTIYAGSGADHFDSNVMPHDHFICRSCQSIQDLPRVSYRPFEALAEDGFAGVVEESYTYYYGLCAACKQLLAGDMPDNK